MPGRVRCGPRDDVQRRLLRGRHRAKSGRDPGKLQVNEVGAKNRYRHELARKTTLDGSYHNARVRVFKCEMCGAQHGRNSTDAWERKSPVCQIGKAKPELRMNQMHLPNRKSEIGNRKWRITTRIGCEPRQTETEAAVLPLHHRTRSRVA